MNTAATPLPDATVQAVHLSATHHFSKATSSGIELLAGLGVRGDAHCGTTVKHRSRVARDPTQPNLRQVHLLQAELFDELQAAGRSVRPGDMGENITTRGIALLDLPTGTRLHIGTTAIVALTGLRNPCAQIEDFQPGLLAAVLGRAPDGSLVRKAGVMAVVEAGGWVAPGATIAFELPPEPHRPLERI